MDSAAPDIVDFPTGNIRIWFQRDLNAPSSEMEGQTLYMEAAGMSESVEGR